MIVTVTKQVHTSKHPMAILHTIDMEIRLVLINKLHLDTILMTNTETRLEVTKKHPLVILLMINMGIKLEAIKQILVE